jgi:hypothetical protein
MLLAVILMGVFQGCADKRETQKPPLGAAANSRSPIRFTDVSESAGLGGFHYENGEDGRKLFPEAMGSGAGFIDYDGDGWQDLLLSGGGVWSTSNKEKVPAVWLYRNNGDGTFSIKTEEAGLAGISSYSLGIAVADFDNDGDSDFFCSTLYENLLFRNDGGVFTEVGEEYGIADDAVWSTSCLFFDADNDGWLDLFVGNYVEWSEDNDLFCSLDGRTKSYCTPELYQGIHSNYYHNNGDGTFTNVTAKSEFAKAPGKTLGVADFDFNRDGWSDLIVANDTQRDELYINNGDGTFTEKGALSGMAYDENGLARAGMGIDVGFVDDTGEATIFVGNFTKQMISVFRHVGNGLFIDRAAISKIGRASLMTLTFGLFLFDVDLDGDLDLYTANGHVQREIENAEDGIDYAQPSHLFLNDGKGNFSDIAPDIGGPMQIPIVGRGAFYSDYDHDGDLDIFVTDNRGPVHLWRNEYSGPNAFLRVKLKDPKANLEGLGAHVVASVAGRRIERRMRCVSSFLSCAEKTITFGLAEASVVDTLSVFWVNGNVDRYYAVNINCEIEITQGAAEPALLWRIDK